MCNAVEYLHTFKAPRGVRSKYAPEQSQPIHDADDQRQALLSGGQHQDQSTTIETHAPGKEDEPVPWAHRDIKPGNIMLADDGKTPILMDFGSAIPARIEIHNRQEALKQQVRYKKTQCAWVAYTVLGHCG